MVLDTLPESLQTELDRLVEKLFAKLRSKERGSYPRLNFSKGFSKLTMLTSDEWAGKLFVLLIVLQTDLGKEIFEKAKIFSEKNVELSKDFENQNLLAMCWEMTMRANNLDEELQKSKPKPDNEDGEGRKVRRKRRSQRSETKTFQKRWIGLVPCRILLS